MDKNFTHDIQKYLDGDLSQEELQLFEMDNDLLQEVATYREIDVALEALGAEQLQSDIKNWEKETRKKRQVGQVRRLRAPMAIAAVVAAFLAIGLYLFIPSAGTSEDVFAAYFEPYPDLITTRAGNESLHLTRGMDAYNNGNYILTVQALKEHLQSENPTVEVELYLGIAELTQGNGSDALHHFSQLLDHPLMGQHASWYLGLTHLQLDQLESAKEIFSGIAADDNHFCQLKASRILAEIQ